MTLDDLIERLEAATGPDRELDVAIGLSLSLFVFERRGRDKLEWYYPTWEDAGAYEKYSTYYGSTGRQFPAYTSDLNAALALVERKLPGRFMEYVFAPMGTYSHRWYISNDGGGKEDNSLYPYNGVSKSMPVAILLALFRALKAQETT